MTVGAGRRLLSIALLNGGAPDRLDEWGNRAGLGKPVKAPTSIPALFAAQVTRAPGAPALTFEGRLLTYRELDEAANRLAHLLAGHGAGPGQSVALLLPRSADAIVAILAVLKTGAAYLPIDPALPAARMEFMLADAAPIIAVTRQNDRLDGVDLALIDVAAADVESQPITALPGPAPDDIAHIIYTSGTPGMPKGFAVTHRNVTRLFDSPDVGLPLSPDAVWTQFHSYAFDFSIWEIWGPLLHGGRVVVVPDSATRSVDEFHALLLAEQVTTF